jgi:hypothetical protein
MAIPVQRGTEALSNPTQTAVEGLHSSCEILPYCTAAQAKTLQSILGNAGYFISSTRVGAAMRDIALSHLADLRRTRADGNEAEHSWPLLDAATH